MKRNRSGRPVPVVFDLDEDGDGAGGPWPSTPGWGHEDRLDQATFFRFQVRRYLSALGKRWWLVLAALLVAGTPAVVYALLKPPTFASQATMYMGVRVNLPEGRLYSEEVTSYLGTQAELIQSPTVTTQAFHRLCLQFPDVAARGTNSPANPAAFDISVRTAPRSSTLEIQALGPTPELTRVYLDKVIEAYLEFRSDTRKQTSVSALSGITEQIDRTRSTMDAVEERLSRFQASNNLSFITESGVSAGSRLARIAEQLSDLRTEDRLLSLLTPDQIIGLNDTGTGISSSAPAPGERTARTVAAANAAYQTGYYQAMQQLQLLKAKRDSFSQVLRPTHSKMIKLSQDIAGFEQLLKTLKEEGEEQARAQVTSRRQSLQLQIQSLEAQSRTWETNAVGASQKLAEHDRMKQELQRSQALYDRLLTLVQSVDLSKTLDQEPLSALAPASAARRTRIHYLLAAGGLLLGLGLGVGLALLTEFFNDRFTSVRELSLHFGEEVVGQIPDSASGRRRETGSLLLGRVPEEHAFVESFRSLRSSLLFMPVGASKPKIVLVTSSVPKEGKTTVSSNLAATLAQAGSRVLLVDADLRRGALHRVFEVNRKPGLWEVLSQGHSPSQAIVATQIPNLSLLPSGGSHDCGSEVFLRHPADQLLRELATQFDFVLVDSAPVLATDDATTLAPKVDGILLVVRASHTSSQMAKEALDRLLRREGKILGLVFNRAAPSADYYSRYTRDYYGPQPERTGT